MIEVKVKMAPLSENEHSCRTCIHYWSDDRIYDLEGLCLCHAPSPILVHKDSMEGKEPDYKVVWPAVPANGYCGEWVRNDEVFLPV